MTSSILGWQSPVWDLRYVKAKMQSRSLRERLYHEHSSSFRDGKLQSCHDTGRSSCKSDAGKNIKIKYGEVALSRACWRIAILGCCNTSRYCIVSRFAQFITTPEKSHWIAAKRVLRYLAGTSQMGLIYTPTDQPVFGYSDADWCGNIVDRRSYSDYVFLMSGAAISWKS